MTPKDVNGRDVYPRNTGVVDHVEVVDKLSEVHVFASSTSLTAFSVETFKPLQQSV